MSGAQATRAASGAQATRSEVCAVALADALRGSGERLVSCFGLAPQVGARLAKLSFEPDLLLTDGICSLLAEAQPISGPRAPDGPDAPEPVVEGWLPFRSVFDLLWNGRRHVVMVASQIDRHGNQNFACIGPHPKPKAQLLGMRGAPGNTIHHRTSYWIPNHSPKVFVEQVDVVSGVGYDRAAALGPQSARFHDIHRVVSNLGVFDFETPERRMRLRSRHPGVSAQEIAQQTGFELAPNAEEAPETRAPAAEELRLIREFIDPEGRANSEVREVRG
ncbi:MAG: CoA-transferase [Deltaproteobacteria bacterium]|nr:CoA-transferase [Deltaproteobacteria bacterium]